ncbi:major facilitator superfamily domain-containing protein [Dipodascopsis uninucleata]
MDSSSQSTGVDIGKRPSFQELEHGSSSGEVVDRELARYLNHDIVIDKKTNKELFWKVNKRILTIMLGTYFCQSLDKGTLGFSSIMGIKEDAHLVGDQYSWLGTIVYIGILVGEYPTNFLIQKLPVAKYLAVNVFCWGIVITCSAASSNFAGLMVIRFLLGIFESCVQPIFIILTAMWYTRDEQAVLTSIWYGMTGVQLMVGGLVAYGVSHYTDGVIKPWQLLFLVLGIATTVWAVFIGWYLPDSPITAKCFSEEEKVLLVERVRANQTGIGNKNVKIYQLKEALLDPLVLLYALLQFTSTLIIGGLTIFSNIIVNSFGFSDLNTQLLNIIQGVITIIIMVGSATVATYLEDTSIVMFIWTLPSIFGTVMVMRVTPTESTRIGLLLAFYCMQFFLAQGNLIFSLISRNVAGQTKKSVTLTITFLSWGVGNMIAPQIFQSSDAPRYTRAFTMHLFLYFIFLLFLIAARFSIIRRNRINLKYRMEALQSDDESHLHAFDDLTDIENRTFRYSI